MILRVRRIFFEITMFPNSELNVLLNNAIQGCPAVQQGERPIVLLLHVVVLVDDSRVDVGDYVDGVLLRQALRGERDLEVDILWRDSGQSHGPPVRQRGCYHSGR